MKKDYSKELDNMKHLINYGCNESKSNNSNSIVEYQAKGADGKTYGILKEGTKFYIKVAPRKDTQVLAEDFDFIGGYMNKKEYEYPTYSAASKNFDLKLMSVNEAYGNKKPIVEQYSQMETAEWQGKKTKELRNELNRFNQLSENVDSLLNKNNHLIDESFDGHTLPEAPSKHTDPKTAKGNPYDKKANPNAYKDFKKTKTDPKSAGAPFDTKVTLTDSTMQSDKSPKGSKGEVYTEKPKYAPKGSTKKGKSTGKTVKLTEEQVLSWNDDMNFMDTSNGTEIGCGAPFTEPVKSKSNSKQNNKCCDKGKCDCKSEEYVEIDINEDEIPYTDAMGFNDPEDNYFGDENVDEYDGFDSDTNLDYPSDKLHGTDLNVDMDDTEFEDFYGNDDLENGTVNMDDTDDFDYIDDDNINIDDDFDIPQQSNSLLDDPEDEYVEDDTYDYGNLLGYNESELHEFGKHPRYGKEPMTTPKNADSSKFGKDWNDSSAKGQSAYGKSKGKTNDKKVSKQPVTEDELHDFGKHPRYGKEPMTTPKNADSSKFGKDWNDESAKGQSAYGKSKGKTNDKKVSKQPVTEESEFGKHPAYQKSAFETPENTETSVIGHEWDDESTTNEQPYGSQIGDGAPFTDELVDSIAESVMNALKKKL